jgi:hypothetical protein
MIFGQGGIDVYCALCNERIASKPVTQDGETYCSLECANAANGITGDEDEGYYDEDEIEGLYEEEE